MLTLLTLYGFTDAKPARESIQVRGAQLAKAVGAGRCRFYERPDFQGLAGTLWVPGCHLIFLNTDWLDRAQPEFVEWVLCHELGHVVGGHARWLWRREISRIEAEREADEFADRMTSGAL